MKKSERIKTGYALKTEAGTHPFLYSAEHQAWKAAVIRNDERAIREHDVEWRRRFNRPFIQFTGEAYYV